MLNKRKEKPTEFYVEKKWFEIQEVLEFNVTELRLLLLYSGYMVESLTNEQKTWLTNRNKNIDSIDNAKEKLISLGLIEKYKSEDSECSEEYYKKVSLGRFNTIPEEDIKKVKNIRQLFILCAYYNPKMNWIVSEKLIKNVFGTRVSQYWNRTCSQLGVSVERVQSPSNGGVMLVVNKKQESIDIEEDADYGVLSDTHTNLLEINEDTNNKCNCSEYDLFNIVNLL